MRALGVDLGSRRIGIAVSNSEGTVAVPYDVIERTGDPVRDRAAIIRAATEAEAEMIVVGMPYSLDGSMGPTARRMSAEIEAIRKDSPVEVTVQDERFTTVTAERSLRQLNLRAAERRKTVDAVAASVLLQAWLDSGKGRER